MSSPAATSAHRHRDQVQTLREQMQSCASREPGELIASGSPALDQLLPEGGFRRGTLVEWLAAGRGSGAASLALLAARQACGDSKGLVVLDRQRRFYPPAALARGIPLDQMIVVRADNGRDEAWAADQALRSPGVAAVLCWPEKLDERTFRRWQLAAESSGVLGLLIRPHLVRDQPSWAEARLLVSPVGRAELPLCAGNRGLRARGTEVPHYERIDSRRLRVELLRCRGGIAGGSTEVEIDGSLDGDGNGLRNTAFAGRPAG
jgi:hypothetical protein